MMKCFGRKWGMLLSSALIVFLVLVIVISVVVVVIIKDDGDADDGDPSYVNGAVAADVGACSDIGVSTLKQNGSAVDAAIATLFCLGATNIHSSGIGGGMFMVVYVNNTRSSWFYNGRERAPRNASRDMFVNKSLDAKQGARAVGVPGEVRAMYAAWQEHGKLPWKQLVEPAIELCKKGFLIHKTLYTAMVYRRDLLFNDTGFRNFFFKANGTMLGLGERLYNPELGQTLTKISRDPLGFYNGDIASTIANDIQTLGGIITKEDLQNYTVVQKKALKVKLDERYTLLTSHPPSSGPVLAMILKILNGYKFSDKDKDGLTKTILTEHRIVEAFKFAYAYRALLGDPEYEDAVTKLVTENMTSDVFTESLRQKISDDRIHNVSYYGGFYSDWKGDGTTHLSVVSKNGDAVAVTATINTWFGSKVRSPTLGIVYNNEMDDFSTPGLVNVFGVQPSPRNYIKPGKRMMSSMSPTIFVDTSGRVRLAVGGSGGTRITTAVAQVIANYLWFGQSLKESVKSPRLHHQLVPTYIRVERSKSYQMKKAILDGLVKLGHTYKYLSGAVVQAVSVDELGKIDAVADPRKLGRAAGY